MQLQWIVLVLLLGQFALDHAVFWRGFQRRRHVEPTRARHLLWGQWAAMLWAATALVAMLWLQRGLPGAELGLAGGGGWRFWTPIALAALLAAQQGYSAVKVARMTGDKRKLRAQVGDVAAVMPQTSAELPAWAFLSLTAGFCEELIFRGFMIWLLQPVVGWWGAAALSMVVFGLGHLYQGLSGVIRTTLFGGIMTLLFWLAQSLWPVIVLHAAIDLMGGVLAMTILREPAPTTADAAASAA